MYNKEQVKQRFLEEAERLLKENVAKSYSKLAQGCELQAYHFSDIRQGRTDVSLMVLVQFVAAYKQHGVSYGYILDGKREQPVVPQTVIRQAEKAKQELEKALHLLSGDTPQ